jgi:hypothetical protein
MPQAQVIMDFDPPVVTNPHLYNISNHNNNTVLLDRTTNYGRRGTQDYSYYFDGGTNTRIDIRDVPERKTFSLSLWIYPEIQRTYQTIISKGTGRKIYTNNDDGNIKINYFGTDYIIGPIRNASWSQIGISLNDEGMLKTYSNNGDDK